MSDIAKTNGPRTIGFDPSVEERRLRVERNWERVLAARQSGEILTGVATGESAGGLLVDVGGIAGFLPASQVRMAPDAALASLVQKKLPLVVVDVDVVRRRIVASHRRALETMQRAKRTALLRSLQVGAVYEATVVRLAPFGAFVDIGGVEGLVPMSELAFERVESASDILNVGDRLDVAVLRIEEAGRKIAFSRKNALSDPWRDRAELLQLGTVVEGKVIGKEIGKDAGLRIELAAGIVGALRDSDADPADYEIGETIEVVVRFVDRRNRRIRLATAYGVEAGSETHDGFASLGDELAKGKTAP